MILLIDVTSLIPNAGVCLFFITKQEKARVVFDGAATFKGAALNDAVHCGINLLNGFVEVLQDFEWKGTLARLI